MVEAGETVGSVVLRRKIAEGGMGTIWVGEHVGLCREVAVKILSRRIAGNPETLQRFTLEARLLARISSPYTPQVFDHGVRQDGTPYIVMELIHGTELWEWVATRGLLSVRQVGRIIEHVTQALTAAHDLGIVHRDVKPENIILSGGDNDFQVKLIDFGIAKSQVTRLGAITLVGATVGTPGYMSPEQIMGSSTVDGRADLWSLAAVAYWCLTGKLPIDADTVAGAYLASREGRLTPIADLRPDLPAGLRAWFATGLAHDVAKRFQSAAQMSEAFKAGVGEKPMDENVPIPLVRHLPTLPSRDAITVRAPRSGRGRTPVLAVIGAAVGVMLAMAARAAPEGFTPARVARERAQETATAATRQVSALGEWVKSRAER
jgi:serine/threonine protein kinase